MGSFQIFKEIENKVKYSKSKQHDTREILNLIDKLKEEKKLKFEGWSLEQKREELHQGVLALIMVEFLQVYDSVVKEKMGQRWNLNCTSKMEFKLRDTQRVAIIYLLRKFLIGNILVQVSTGEGKSLIVAGVAIFCARPSSTENWPISSATTCCTPSTVAMSAGIASSIASWSTRWTACCSIAAVTPFTSRTTYPEWKCSSPCTCSFGKEF
jgi:hypothetical protein